MSVPKAYFACINGHGIGDSLDLMCYDVAAQKCDIELYWVVHLGCGDQLNPELNEGWYHFALFNLYERANLFRNKILIQHVNWANLATVDRSVFRKYVRQVYGVDRELLPFNEHPQLANSCGMRDIGDELRKRFAFLRGSIIARDMPYVTIQPASTHFSPSSGHSYGHAKRLSLTMLRMHLPWLTQDGEIWNIVLVGSISDQPLMARAEQWLNLNRPDLSVTNCSGGTLEEYWQVLYGSARHLCCESSSGLFTGALETPTRLCFEPNENGIKAIYDDRYRGAKQPEILFDVFDCRTHPNADDAELATATE